MVNYLQKGKVNMILAVVGSGGDRLESTLTRLGPEVVLTGRFWGTDERVRSWAMANGVTVITLDPNFIKHGSRATTVRAQQTAMVADEMLVSGVNATSLQAAHEMQNLGKMVWNEDDFRGSVRGVDDGAYV